MTHPTTVPINKASHCYAHVLQIQVISSFKMSRLKEVVAPLSIKWSSDAFRRTSARRSAGRVRSEVERVRKTLRRMFGQNKSRRFGPDLSELSNAQVSELPERIPHRERMPIAQIGSLKVGRNQNLFQFWGAWRRWGCSWPSLKMTPSGWGSTFWWITWRIGPRWRFEPYCCQGNH